MTFMPRPKRRGFLIASAPDAADWLVMNEEIPPWAKEIIDRLERIEGKLGQPSQPMVLSIGEAMARTRHRSRSTFYRWTKAANVHSCSPGSFLTEHIDHGLRVVAVGKRWRKK